MAKRILLAGILGGLALFLWETVAHMLTPLGDPGIQGLGNEQAVLATLKENIKAPRFYFFPAPENKPGMTKGQQQQAMQVAMDKWRTGPSGILIFHPNGAESLSARQLLTQFGCDVVAMLLAAMLLARAGGLKSYTGRLGFVALMGLFPTLRSELPYWNWYGFPRVYMAAQFTVHLGGFLVGGLVLARFIRPVPECRRWRRQICRQSDESAGKPWIESSGGRDIRGEGASTSLVLFQVLRSQSMLTRKMQFGDNRSLGA